MEHRYYHSGSVDPCPPVVEKGGKTWISIPPGYRNPKDPIEIECDPHAVLLHLDRFHVVPPGGSIALDLPPETVKRMAPHLDTEEEHQRRIAARAPVKGNPNTPEKQGAGKAS